MTPAPFSASWASGVRQRTWLHRFSSACRPNLTGYHLARVIVQRPPFVKKFCRILIAPLANRSVKPFQCPLNHNNPRSKSRTLRAPNRAPPAVGISG